MSINILTEPSDPPISGDYSLDQAIQHANEVPMLSILSDWESTSAEPTAKQGAFIRHAGNTFQVQTADETISGSPAAGLNYIIATESGGVITLAWATSITGYSYNPAYGGVYNSSGLQALHDVCYLEDSAYLRGMSFAHDFNGYFLADGKIFCEEIRQSRGRPVLASLGATGNEATYFNELSPLLTEGVETFCAGQVLQSGSNRFVMSITKTSPTEIELFTGYAPVVTITDGSTNTITLSISL